MFQHLPEGEEGRDSAYNPARSSRMAPRRDAWSGRKAEELRTGAAVDDLVWRLLHEEEEVRTLDAGSLSRAAVQPDYIASVIARSRRTSVRPWSAKTD
jgi:molecular chaperone Hsp33